MVSTTGSCVAVIILLVSSIIFNRFAFLSKIVKKSEPEAIEKELVNNNTSSEKVKNNKTNEKKMTREQAFNLYKNRKQIPPSQVLNEQFLQWMDGTKESRIECQRYGIEMRNKILNSRKYIDQTAWACISRPQYKYSCGVSSLTAVWNYLFSSLGNGCK